ncbi:unnamed protein product [Effrenium voratum]|nr:unnamed protein product [Effrenium voratum]
MRGTLDLILCKEQMTVSVKIMGGGDLSYTLDSAASADELISKLEENAEDLFMGADPRSRVIVFQGKVLRPGGLLYDYGIEHGSVIHLALRTRLG